MNINKLIERYNCTSSVNGAFIALKVINGLGNRLRAYAFYAALAKKLNRKLLLCWEPGVGFDDTTFHDLFTNTVHLINGKEFSDIQNNSINLNDFITSSKCGINEISKGIPFDDTLHKREVLNNNREYGFNILELANPDYGQIPLSIETGNNVWENNFLGIQENYYKELQSLTLTNPIKEKVDSITSNFGNTYGLHVRKGDAIDKNNSYSINYYESYDDTYFIRLMKKLIKEDDNATFFLSTDSKESYAKFTRNFPACKFINNPFKQYYVSDHARPKDGQVDALIDMMVLSRTKKIFGTSNSAFSTLSSIIGNKKLVLSNKKPPEIKINEMQPQAKKIKEIQTQLKKIHEGISIITAIKDRNENLAQSLKTWVDNPIVNEIIIIDWSSSEAVEDVIKKYEDKNIILVKVANEEKWILSHAYNLALQFVNYNKVIKLDADIKISSTFFDVYELKPGIFYTGNWELATTLNERHLNGVVFAYLTDLLNVNGYDERITIYGYDDTDLYNRLYNNGLKRKNILPTGLTHIPHDDSMRLKHQKIGKRDTPELFIEKNKELTESMDQWGLKNHNTRFNVVKVDNNNYNCDRIKDLIYLNVKGTLADRLKTYYSCKKLAADLQRELCLIWCVDLDCTMEFNEFFINELNIIEKSEIPPLENMDIYLFFSGQSTSKHINLFNNKDIYIESRCACFYENGHIVMRKDTNTFPPSFKKHLRTKAKKLIPVPKFKKELREYIHQSILNVNPHNKKKLVLNIQEIRND